MKLRVIYEDLCDKDKKSITPKLIEIISQETEKANSETGEYFDCNVNTKPEFIYCLVISKLIFIGNGLIGNGHEKLYVKNVHENIQDALKQLTTKLAKKENKNQISFMHVEEFKLFGNEYISQKTHYKIRNLKTTSKSGVQDHNFIFKYSIDDDCYFDIQNLKNVVCNPNETTTELETRIENYHSDVRKSWEHYDCIRLEMRTEINQIRKTELEKIVKSYYGDRHSVEIFNFISQYEPVIVNIPHDIVMCEINRRVGHYLPFYDYKKTIHDLVL